MSSSWITHPTEAHRQWREGLTVGARDPRGYADHSQRQYAALFGAFARWMAGQKTDLTKIDVADLERFFAQLTSRDGTGPASDRTVRTYAAEISRVMDHLQAIEPPLRQDNPAKDFIKQAKSTHPLRARETFLPAIGVQSRYLEALGRLDPTEQEPEALRGHAMALLMLQEGMTHKEIQKLTLANASGLPVHIHAPGHRTLQARTLTLSPITAHWVGAWMAIRTSLHVITPEQYRTHNSRRIDRVDTLMALASPGPASARVFVSRAGRADKAQALRSKGLAINRISDDAVYNAARQVFELAETPIEHDRGAQTLRNLCCARMISQGMSDDDVASRLGLVCNDQVAAMRLMLYPKQH